MKQCLLIWEMIPEETILYLIPSEEMHKHFSKNELKLIHKRYIGHMNDKPTNVILEKLSEQLRNWEDYKLDTSIDLENSKDEIDFVLCSGFLM
jgi:hypothetical protein